MAESCKHGIANPNNPECYLCWCEAKGMSGCVPDLRPSEKEINDNSLYTKIKALETENKNLLSRIRDLKEIIKDLIDNL